MTCAIFFRRYIPPFTRVLLVESGSRGSFDTLIPLLNQIHGEAMELDLVTCHQTTPVGFRGRVYRVEDYSGPSRAPDASSGNSHRANTPPSASSARASPS